MRCRGIAASPTVQACRRCHSSLEDSGRSWTVRSVFEPPPQLRALRQRGRQTQASCWLQRATWPPSQRLHCRPRQVAAVRCWRFEGCGLVVCPCPIYAGMAKFCRVGSFRRRRSRCQRQRSASARRSLCSIGEADLKSGRSGAVPPCPQCSAFWYRHCFSLACSRTVAPCETGQCLPKRQRAACRKIRQASTMTNVMRLHILLCGIEGIAEGHLPRDRDLCGLFSRFVSL